MDDREVLLEQLERLAVVLDCVMPGCAELVRKAISLLRAQEDNNKECQESYWNPIFCAKCGAVLGSREIKIKKEGTNNG